MRDLQAMAQRLLALDEEFYAREVVMEVVHAALQTQSALNDQQEVNRDMMEKMDALYGRMAVALGQAQIGNLKGVTDILAANLLTRGHNARIEGT